MSIPVDEKYLQFKEKVANLAVRHSRNPSEIQIVAVSKYYSWEHVFPAYQAGCRNFGENRLQEFFEKKEEAPPDVCWHFLGTLQKNKVRKAIGNFVLIHSVDSYELAQKISSCSLDANTETSLLLQVNTSGEISKHGLNVEECKNQLENLMNLPAIKIKGLMTMAPLTQDEHIIHNCFSDLRNLRDRLEEQTGNTCKFPYLSMGMSQDFQIAIEEGATHLRIGTALFEPNP